MQSANTWARTALKKKYYEEFRFYYNQLRNRQFTYGLPRKEQNKLYSKANGYAVTQIVMAHREEYNFLYRQGRNNGLPHTHGWVSKAEREGARDK